MYASRTARLRVLSTQTFLPSLAALALVACGNGLSDTRFATGSQTLASSADYSSVYAVSEHDGVVSRLDIKTGSVFELDLGGETSRIARNDENVFDYGQRVANELETEILRVGPQNVMAFVAETVVGATLGAVPPVEGYFKRIREICDQYDVLLILDEVMCGMGRTGSLFACEQYGIIPDILTIAKGLGAGYQPIGAMMCTAPIYNVIADGSGFFQHGHTYLAHPTACAAAETVVSSIIERKLVKQVSLIGDCLISELNHAFGQHPHIGDIRGKGLFIGLELVENRLNKAPFEASKQISKNIKASAFSEGLMCYPMAGTVDGNLGDHILLAPPFIMENRQIDEIVVKLAKAIKKVLQI